MHFYYVDQISKVSEDTVLGCKKFSLHEPMQYSGTIAPGVVSEAIGQLASWLALKNNKFKGRPVFLFADEINILKYARPGDTLELKAHIDGMDEQTLLFSGTAAVNGVEIQNIKNCSCYFMDLDQLEEKATVEDRFTKLINTGGLQEKNEPLNYKFQIEDLITNVLAITKETVSAAITVPEDSWFFKDHFPKFPVTPIVVINEIIGHLATLLQPPTPGMRLKVIKVSEIKIKNFVRPDETCQFNVTLLPMKEGSSVISTQAEVVKNKKLVMRGRYDFEITREV